MWIRVSAIYFFESYQNYLQAGNSAKITRVLGTGGWIFNTSRKLAAITTGSKIIASTNSKPYSLGATLYDITLNSNQDTNSCKNSLFSFSSGL